MTTRRSFIFVFLSVTLITTTGCDHERDYDADYCFDGNYYITNASDMEEAKQFDCICGALIITGTDLEMIDLPNLVWMTGNLVISDNPDLVDVDGLAKLDSVEGELRIISNGSLSSLDGLSNLVHVGHNVYIDNNPELANLDGLCRLEGLDGSFIIQGNDALDNLEGLEGVTSLGGDLQISDNDGLYTLFGVHYLRSLGGDLIVSANDLLPQCEACDLLDLITEFSGDFHFAGNQPDTCTDDCT